MGTVSSIQRISIFEFEILSLNISYIDFTNRQGVHMPKIPLIKKTPLTNKNKAFFINELRKKFVPKEPRYKKF